MRAICAQIDEEMRDASSGPPLGFLLMVFEFGPDGFCAHGSNARREDVVKLLRKHADVLEAGVASTKGDA